jgi:cell division protein FtsQ
MAGRGPARRGLRLRAHERDTVISLPRRAARHHGDFARLVPSGRALLIAFGTVAAAFAGFWLARESPIFAVTRIDVGGAPPGISRQVERALADRIGGSLLKLDVDRADAALERLATVHAATLDRAFPHTLRVVVVPERPVAVVRQGADSWLVSARGRVMGSLARGARWKLPRIWVKRDVRIATGSLVTGQLRVAVAAVAPLAAARLPARIATVSTSESALTLKLRSGLELRLGEPAEVSLKLAVAARVLPLLDVDTTYLDVSVPARPVAS